MKGKFFFIFLFLVSLLSSQALAGWDIFAPEAPPGLAPGAACLINGPCSMNTDIYMNGNTIYNVSIANLVVTYEWDDIQNIPAGFADDIDNDTQYTADEVYINLVANQFILNEAALNNTIINIVESGVVSLDWNDLINIPSDLDVDRTDDIITSTNFGGDVSGTYANIQLVNDAIGDNELNYSDVTLLDFTNDAGYITGVNWTDIGNIPAGFADGVDNDTTYENLSEFVNDVGYLTNATLTDIWVNETGDTMTGDLNMSNHSIMNVWELNVHNITGNSPVYVSDELIVNDNVVAKGNITVEGDYYVIAENYLGETFTFINPVSGETLMTVSETVHPTFGDDLGDVVVRTLTVDRLIITGLLNYSDTEPPDYYFSDESWIIKTSQNGTSFLFAFNESLLNTTVLEQIVTSDINWTQIENLPPELDINWSDDVMLDTLFGGDVSGTYDNIQINADTIGDAEINYSEVTVGDFFNDAQYITFYIFNDTVTFLNQSIIDLANQHYLDMVAVNQSIYNLNQSLTAYVVSLDNATNIRIDALNVSLNQSISDLYNYVNTQNHSGDVVGPYNDLQLQSDVVGDNELNYTDVTLGDLTNDAGYVQYGDETYIYKDNNLSNVVRFNETKLNQTVYLLTGIFEETVNITVSGGVGFGTTVDCCTGANEILDVRVTPTTLTNSYKFSANSSITGEMVDADRAQHLGVWWVAHKGIVVTDENINYYITNALIDEVFSVRVRYQR
jgi:hypothetical protein